MLADKGYIQPKVNQRWKPCILPMLYRGCNAIKRMFGRLKNFRRIAAHYDQFARKYLAVVRLAAAISD